MTDTMQGELPPLPRGLDGALQSRAPHLAREIRDYMREYGRQCIATMKAENERLREEVAIRAQANRDDARHKDNYAHDLDKYATLAEAAQSQAAAMAGLLAKARAKMRGAVEPDDVALNDAIDAAIQAAKSREKA